MCSLWLVKPLVNPLVNTARPSSQACGHGRLQERLVQLSLRLYETPSDAEAVGSEWTSWFRQRIGQTVMSFRDHDDMSRRCLRSCVILLSFVSTTRVTW